MERSSKGLFDFLCSQMEKLDKKQISIEHLKAQAAAGKQLNNVLMYELNRAKFVQKFPNAEIREVE
jgi:hypothetical protein